MKVKVRKHDSDSEESNLELGESLKSNKNGIKNVKRDGRRGMGNGRGR
jgi:hypothetical protein